MDYKSLSRSQKIKTCRNLIVKYKMKPLAFEGGFYTEIFRSGIMLDNDSLQGEYHKRKSNGPDEFGGLHYRSIGSSILFMITRDCFSKLHRLPTEEIYNFYFGDPVNMINITEKSSISFTILGNNIEEGEKFYHIVPKNCWQAAYLVEGGIFAMMGTVMSPGFERSDYEGASRHRSSLLAEHPEHSRLLNKLI